MIAVGEMVALRGGEFQMGSNTHYPEEAPAHECQVDPFAIDVASVTNAQFRAFVEATGYVTWAERGLPAQLAPELPEALRRPGALVFHMTDGPVDLTDFRQWWRFVPDACWYQPEGPGSSLQGREDHPVVQVALPDARAYADWAGKALPTEAEWEFAARDGVDSAFPWGDQLVPASGIRANTWHGQFPWQNEAGPGPFSWPSRSGMASRYGLYNMLGNVWEWTETPFRQHRSKPCCSPSLHVGQESYVTKGGSFLCAPSYCRRYRASARSAQEPRSATNHLGFRCVIRR